VPRQASNCASSSPSRSGSQRGYLPLRDNDAPFLRGRPSSKALFRRSSTLVISLSREFFPARFFPVCPIFGLQFHCKIRAWGIPKPRLTRQTPVLRHRTAIYRTFCKRLSFLRLRTEQPRMLPLGALLRGGEIPPPPASAL
jgi:hypothetical protein